MAPIKKKERDSIVSMFKEDKLSKRKIAEETGRSYASIKNILKLEESGKDYITRKKYDSTLRFALSKQQVAQVVKFVLANKQAPLDEIIYELDLDCDRRTVARRLKEHNIRTYSGICKALLSEANKKQRRNFCLKYKDWTAEDWKKVAFVDEAYIRNFKIGKNFFRGKKGDRKKCENFVRYDASKTKLKANFFGFISFFNSKIYEIKDNFNSQKLLKILREGALDLMAQSCEFILLDNAGYHFTPEVVALLKTKLKIISIPAYSPDINAIENIWGTLKEKTRMALRSKAKKINSSEDLFKQTESDFNKLSKQIRSVCNSMPNRIQRIIAREGDMSPV